MNLDWCGRNVMVFPLLWPTQSESHWKEGREQGAPGVFSNRGDISSLGGTERLLSPLFTLTLRSVLESVTREFLVYLLNAPALPDLAALCKGMRFLSIAHIRHLKDCKDICIRKYWALLVMLNNGLIIPHTQKSVAIG